MTKTRLIIADDMAHAFNGVTERQYWRATVGGTRLNPEVHFNSRASMVRITYDVAEGTFSLAFAKSAAAWGDFLASAHRSMVQVLTGLKAAGLPFAAPLGDGLDTLRVTYDPVRKAANVSLAIPGDEWQAVEPLPFKVPERKSTENPFSGLDGL